ncbi:hypothetical protein CY34DRAFT_24782 [Suillus luteus UH-Slu-Lm8-n1]|uniref:CxC1-like cysteine cluster associated with KDZ transposases domain-containing protein n=1 Tax=Suillus luteus UH-Slu-Lm8-n1 TaxID=930992 RepID=A0A0D0B244_9AGAM|nr:hypothetical protein CY34DRAFT_24782 [Suillus luteus UH-Slu-Lm8-n1]
MDFENILTGAHLINVSHAGSEFQDLVCEIFGDFWTPETRQPNKRGHHEDHRTRRDRIQRRVDAFLQQMPALTDAYLAWSLKQAKKGVMSFFEVLWHSDPHAPSDPNCGTWNLKVVDTFYADNVSLTIASTDRFVASALVRHGVIPCSPISPSVAISIDALELYRVARLCNPHFSIQAYVKSICDLHGTIFHRYLSRQFSIAFDLYLHIRTRVNSLIDIALGRNAVDWHLKNTCPCCTYELEDDAPMSFKLLYTMDSNDSLKRVSRQLMGADGDRTGPSIELPTTQRVNDNRYLLCDYVNSWANAAEAEGPTDDENPCAGHWKNMDEEKTKKTWGVYDETGIFIAVCRHGFYLLIADMVQSGERAKYPLAVVAKLLNSFGAGLGGGYDIGCQFKTTLNNSILGPQARTLRHSCLVGAFHGHAHRRICQLDHLAMYVEGLGLEDLETCERMFSKSNALASTIRYASVFHHQQLISAYFQHNDKFDVYPNLGNFLYNNYRQALDILNNGQINLSRVMQDLDITDVSVFNQWITNEKEYLQGLKSEPEQETLQMEYWQKLVNLAASHASFCASDAAMTRRLETTRRHALENFEKDLQVVQDLESKLGYQHALNALEGLVVACIFELTKLNRSGTGYKLRKHIAKALQTRSSTIRSALDHYNAAALSLTPPRRTLKWDKVIEYAFLADFDLLRDARQDISQRPWATPAARQATDLYFKMCRAKEEVLRLNNEIRRLVTYIHDKECYLQDCYTQLEPSCPALAHQISLQRLVRSRANAHLLQRVADIARLQGFSGSINIGESTKKSLGDSASVPHAQIPDELNVLQDFRESPSFTSDSADMQDELEDEEDDAVAIEEAVEAFHDVLRVSADA